MTVVVLTDEQGTRILSRESSNSCSLMRRPRKGFEIRASCKYACRYTTGRPMCVPSVMMLLAVSDNT